MLQDKEQRFFLGFICLYIWICPVFGYLGGSKIPAAFSVSVIGAMLIKCLWCKNRKVAILGAMAIAAPWLCAFALPPQAAFLEHILAAVFFVSGALILLFRVIRDRQHNTETLAMALSTYLLVGIGFAHSYLFLSALGDTACVRDLVTEAPLAFSDYIYFSMVTLTTLGYGDIVPVTSWARTFALTEVFVGVFYLAILISRLVSTLSTESKEE